MLLHLLRAHGRLAILVAALSLLTAWVAALPPGVTGQIIDRALRPGNTALLLPLGLQLGAVLLLRELLRIALEYATARLGLGVTGRIRRALWHRLMGAPYQFFTATPRGEMLQRLLADAEALQETALQAVPRFLYDTTTAAVALVAMWRVHPGLTVLAVATVLLATLPGKTVGERRRKLSAETRRNQADLYQQAQERLEAVRLVKTFTAEEREAARFSRLQEAWAALQLKAFLTTQAYMNVPRILESLAPMLIYLAGGYQVFAGRLTLGQLVALAGYLPLVSAPIRSFSVTWLAFKEAAPKLEAALEWLELPREPGRACPRGPVSLDGDIEFDQVTFTYPGAGRPVLDGVSFRIPAGARAALVGPSGGGKSTVLALLARLYEPDSGEIRVGGRPLRQMHPDDLRAAMAVVTQETFLLNETIRQNLTFGLERPVPDAELRAVLQAVRLDDVIDALPEGLHTPLGERGLRLSGGQRQRLALARAFLRRPALLLLDEATSALDNENQAAVQEAIEQVSRGRTSLTVAHRLSTIAGADLVISLENGQVREVASA